MPRKKKRRGRPRLFASERWAAVPAPGIVGRRQPQPAPDLQNFAVEGDADFLYRNMATRNPTTTTPMAQIQATEEPYMVG